MSEVSGGSPSSSSGALDSDAIKMGEMLEATRSSSERTGGNNPISLCDSDSVWCVAEGHLDVFAVEMRDGKPFGQRKNLTRLEAGQVFFGAPPLNPSEGEESEASEASDELRTEASSELSSELSSESSSELSSDLPSRRIELMGVANLSARIERVAISDFLAYEDAFQVAEWIELWTVAMESVLMRWFEPSRESTLLEAEKGVSVEEGTRLSGHPRVVVWVSSEDGALRHAGGLLPPSSGRSAPLTYASTLIAESSCAVDGSFTAEILFGGKLESCLLGYCDLFARAVRRSMARDRDHSLDALRGHETLSLDSRRSAVGALRGVLETGMPSAPSEGDARRSMARIMERLGEATRADVSYHLAPDEDPEDIANILRKCNLRYRVVRLRDPERIFTKSDAGFVITLLGDSLKPVLMLPQGGGGYSLFDPEVGVDRPVRSSDFVGMAPKGIMVYPPLPSDVSGFRDLFAFGMRGLSRAPLMIAVVATLSGLASLLTPWFTGKVLTEFIPQQDYALFASAMVALTAAAFAATLFTVSAYVLLVRISGRMGAHLQAAIWGRILRLPTQIFREYTIGDMVDRAGGVDRIREALTAVALMAMLGMVSGTINLFLMLWYSWRLTGIAVLCVFVMALTAFLIARVQVPLQRKSFKMQGRVEGLVYQILTGISKVRVANRESVMFERWARLFAEQKSADYKATLWGGLQASLNQAMSPASTAAILAFIFYGLLDAGYQSDFNLADFLSFNAAFGQFAAATVSFTGALSSLIEIVPLYERIKPIMDCPEEASTSKVHPGVLRGGIEFSRVSFSYAENSPLVVKDVSFKIHPGEYVAFVGESGAGKSTVYRLMIGFERPTQGAVYLDNHLLDDLDPVEVRGQMGVVLQNTEILAGSIADNILAGSSHLTHDDALEAAERAGLGGDLAEMPMGLHTVLSEGGGGLSGGQRQRLIIARALVKQARILLFDEATSALDNLTQSAVQETLDRINTTRVVIAHRLSTIRNVDRVIVMKGGEVVESGSYDSLVAQDGEFKRLVERQMLSDSPPRDSSSA